MTETIWLQDLFRWHWLAFDVSQAFVIEWNETGMTDEVILQKIQGGEKMLFELIVERYSQKMFRYLLHYFSFSSSLAEDVVQEMFIKLRNKVDKYDSKYRFEPWLYRFTHNFTIDWIRKNGKDERVIAFSHMMKNEDWWNNFEELFVVDGEDVKENVNKNVHSETLQYVISRLDDKYREVVLLYYFEEKSYEEIAYVLGKTVNSIGTLLSRAKQKIKILIEQQPELHEILVFDL